MNRRAFIGSVVAVAVAPVKALAPAKPPALALHRDAFALVMAPLQGMHALMPTYVVDHKTGIRVRLVDSWRPYTDIPQRDASVISPVLRAGDIFTTEGGRRCYRVTDDVTAPR
jgi:hypothetical protein